MNYYLIPIYILAALFVLLFFRTFTVKSLKALFQNAKIGAKIDKERERAVEEGKTPFYFRRGAVVIYAKTQARAIYEFKEMKRNEKLTKRGSRK